ncbi:unnamed protein product [Prorocentrum cordatum]|uniref:Calmodulin n=1 Tax=Prorocentrum cordatum TaxID=2364126 RepID=A0ABN9U824_9DINO|nr:unnamed protein product [Polarella glacialis]
MGENTEELMLFILNINKKLAEMQETFCTTQNSFNDCFKGVAENPGGAVLSETERPDAEIEEQFKFALDARGVAEAASAVDPGGAVCYEVGPMPLGKHRKVVGLPLIQRTSLSSSSATLGRDGFVFEKRIIFESILLEDWCMVVGQIAQAAILGAANIGGAWLGRCPPCPQAPGCPAPALSCPPVSLTCPAPPAPPALTCPQVTCAAPACPPCEAPAREEVAPCPSPAREDAGADGRLAACLPLKAVVLIGADSMLAVVSSSDLVPGDVILVRYAADDLWHERVLSWALPVDKSGAVHWVVATPDGDMYVETIEGGSADDSPVEWIRPAADGRLPVGFQDAVYSFQRGEIDGALLEKCVKKGATMALMDAREHGVTPVTMTVARAPGGRRVPIEEVVGAGFVQPALRDGAPDGADAGGAMVAGTATPRTGVWRVVEEGNSLGYDVGREVKPVTVYIGCKGVYSPDGKDSVFVEFSDEDEGDFVKRVAPRPPPKESSAQDARTLAIKFNPQGRMRDWRDVVDSCQQEEFEDFPVSGPRSMSWCLHFLRRRHTPLDHHLMFRSTCSLKPEQWGVAEHETLLRIIELAGQCDQLDVTNLACMEAAARRVQTIEWAYHDKIRETDAGSTSRLSIEEATAFSGLSRAGDLMMVLPALLEHVKLQVEKDAAIMKNIRKAKEERELRRQAVASLANQAIYTLNDLAGSERGSSVSQPGEGRAPHGAVQRRVYAAAAAMGPPPALSPSGALQELRGCTVYEDVQSTVVPYDDMKASLPMSGNRPVPLAELFGAGGQAEVDGFLDSHLLKSEAASHNLKGAPRETYMDEVLRNSPRAYQRLVKRLERAGMIDYTVQPQEFCSLFFVRKKNGSQRLVVDCRRSNCWFSAADPVQLSTGAGLGNLEVPDGARLYVGHVDIKDAFYHFELPERVRNLFALPAVPAWVAGLAEVGGVRVSPGTSVYPRLRVLPMGWSHALWVCQTLHRRIIQVSARDIEKVVGHCTFLALLSRTSLSIFRSVYTFIARHRDHGTVPLWESVRWELEAFRNVIPLIRRDFGAPWSSKVMASDASFWGYGVVSRDLPPDKVQQLGRVSERWRFSGKAQVRSREGVLGPDGELDIGDWVKKVEEDSQEREDALSDLPEVLKERGWAVLMSKKWGVPISNIVQGEVDAQSDHRAAGDSCGAASGPEAARADLPSAGLPSAGSATAEGVLAAERGDGRTCPRLLRSAATQLKAARRALRLPIAGRQRYLQARSVRTEAVRLRYSEFLEELDQWLGPSGLSRRPCPSGRLGAGTVGQFDQDLSDWMNEQYMEGYDHWRGSNMMAAIAWADPRLGRVGGHGLPLSRQALKGWRLLTPASSRLPLPSEVVFAIAMELLVMDRWSMAVCTMLSLVFLMRPGDWRTVRVEHLTPPAVGGSRGLARWSLVLHPLENEGSLPSKTGEFDESLLLDLEEDQWLAPLCQRLVLGRDPQEPLFAFSQAEFARCFKTAGAKLLLQRPPPPYILRHSGASRDFAEQRRTLVGVKRRGRWRTDASVRRYEKGGRLGSEFAKLPLCLQNHARWCLRYLPAALSGSLQPRPPPLRSNDLAPGLKDLSAADQAKVDLGNTLMSFTVSCIPPLVLAADEYLVEVRHEALPQWWYVGSAIEFRTNKGRRFSHVAAWGSGRDEDARVFRASPRHCILSLRLVDGFLQGIEEGPCHVDEDQGLDMFMVYWVEASASASASLEEVKCPKGHLMREGWSRAGHVCDECSRSGTVARCGGGCDYDLCAVCFRHHAEGWGSAVQRRGFEYRDAALRFAALRGAGPPSALVLGPLRLELEDHPWLDVCGELSGACRGGLRGLRALAGRALGLQGSARAPHGGAGQELEEGLRAPGASFGGSAPRQLRGPLLGAGAGGAPGAAAGGSSAGPRLASGAVDEATFAGLVVNVESGARVRAWGQAERLSMCEKAAADAGEFNPGQWERRIVCSSTFA